MPFYVLPEWNKTDFFFSNILEIAGSNKLLAFHFSTISSFCFWSVKPIFFSFFNCPQKETIFRKFLPDFFLQLRTLHNIFFLHFSCQDLAVFFKNFASFITSCSLLFDLCFLFPNLSRTFFIFSLVS